MRQRWLSRRAWLLHVAVMVWVPGCLLAFWWQVDRAFGGNRLSYLYSVEWPLFALTGLWAWWQLVHTDAETIARRAQQRSAGARAPAGPVPPAAPLESRPAVCGDQADRDLARRDQADRDLAAYNDRLARLATEGARAWRHR